MVNLSSVAVRSMLVALTLFLAGCGGRPTVPTPAVLLPTNTIVPTATTLPTVTTAPSPTPPPPPTPTSTPEGPGAEVPMGSLDLEETVRGSVDTAGVRTIWTLEGAADDLLYVQAETVRGQMVPFIALYDSEGYLLANSAAPSEASARLTYTLPEDGEYTLAISAYGEGTGTYEVVAYPLQAGGGEVEYGDTVRGSILGDVTEDMWAFTGEPGDFVDIEVRAEGDDFDPYIELLDADENLIAQDDDSGGDLNPQLIGIPLLAGGTYRIRVAAYASEQPGSYELTLRQGETVIGGSISYDQTIIGELVSGPQVWTFEGQAEERVVIALNATSEELDPQLVLYDPAGQQIASDDDRGGNYNALITIELPASGTYSIYAMAYRGSGAYELTVRRAEPLAAGTLAYGETREAVLEGGQQQIWTFEGRTGEEVEIALRAAPTATDLDLQLLLLDAEGEELAFDDDSGGDLNPLISGIALPADGAYSIVVQAYRGSGAYVLELRQP
ncbi:MAG: pre-peptidase C-terminal domain-containing protein [Ardenticatenaceae bacterium]